MKKRFPFFPLLLMVVLVAAGCSATRGVSFNVALPPVLIPPDHMQNVGVVNRTLPEEDQGKKVLNVIEGVVTGEGLFEDQQGAMASVRGATAQLNRDQVLPAVELDTVKLSGTGTGLTPMPLEWPTVERICRTNQVDGLLVLEVFDTDQAGSTTDNTMRQVRNVANGGRLDPFAVTSSSNTRVRVKQTWRLYDPKTKTIIDEVRLDDYFGANGGRFDLGEFGKRDAIQRSGYVGGCVYATRLMPGAYRARRVYFRRKGKQMKIADRMVEVNDWEEAMQIWEPLTDNPKRKIAGRACHNMAIYHEVHGDLVTAKEWAQKAYTLTGDKRSRTYVRILRDRINSGI